MNTPTTYQALVCVFVFLNVCRGAASAEVLNHDERRQFADGLYARGMHASAVQEYLALLREFPDAAETDVVRFRMGESYLGAGDRTAAARQFDIVVTNHPNSAFWFKAAFRRADIFREDGERKAALDLFDAILDRNPTGDIAAASLYFKGDILLETGRSNEAAEAFQRVARDHAAGEFNSYSLLKLGRIYGGRAGRSSEGGATGAGDDLGKALGFYQAAAAGPVSDRVGAEAWFQMAELYFAHKRFDKSAEAYKELLTKYPSDERAVEASLRAAWAAHNAGFYADALRLTGERLGAERKTDGRESEWLYLKANCERQLMKNDEAVRTYTQLLRTPANGAFAEAARYEKALTHHKMGDFRGAVSEALKLEAAQGLKKDVYWLLAESHSALKEDAEAIQYYRLIVREFPDSDVSRDATYRLAHHLQRGGRHVEAAQYYGAVAQKFQDSELAAPALFASATCLAHEGRHEEAIRDWSALIQKYPAHELAEESVYQKALAETRIGRSDRASASFLMLIQKFPASEFMADARYWRGILLKEAGKLEDAEAELRQGLGLEKQARPELTREIKFALAIVLQKSGKPDEAADLFQALLSTPLREKFSPALLEWLSEQKFGGKQISESMQAAGLLVDCATNAAWQQTGWCLLGRGHLALGATSEAEEAFKKALAVGARTRFAAESALRLGDIALGAGNHAGSAEYFRQAAALASDDSLLGVRARAYAGLGKSALAAADHDGAARYFMSVAVLYEDPELVPECLYNAAAALRKAGRENEALEALAELRKKYPESAWAKKE